MKSLATDDKKIRVLIIVVATVVSTAIFIYELVTPLGYIEWMLYLIPLILLSQITNERNLLLSCVIYSVLIWLGFIYSPPGADPTLGIFNRLHGSLLIWLTASIFVLQRRHQEKRLGLEVSLAATNIVMNTFNSMIDSVAITDLQGNIIQVNRAFTEKYGLTKEELIGKHATEFVFEEDIPKMHSIISECVEKGAVTNTEFTALTKKGKISVLINASLTRDFEDRPTHIVAVLRDITKWKKAERDRNLMFDYSIDMMCIAGFDGFFIQVNPAWQKSLGWTSGELLQKQFLDFVHQEDRESTTNAMKELEANKIVVGFENRYLSKDGSYKWLSWNAYPLSDEKLIFAMARDITERKHMEEMRDRFISAVTHELRTPLTSIKGYVDYILSEPGTLAEKVESSIKIVKRNTDILTQLVNDLLDIQRLAHGRLELNIEPLNLRKLVEECIENTRHLIEQNGHTWILEAPESELTVLADRIRMNQVLMNILDNAVKFTPKGGKIIICINTEEKEVKIQISDTGIGIGKEDLERVFIPFSAIKKPTYFKGTGLGMSVAKGLIETHGGRMWAESGGEGKGSTFIFTLPRKKE